LLGFIFDAETRSIGSVLRSGGAAFEFPNSILNPSSYARHLTLLSRNACHLTCVKIAMARIGQLFINDEKLSTYVCLNNYVSFLVPEHHAPIVVNLVIHNQRGEPIFGGNVTLPRSGSTSICVKEYVKPEECPIGMVTCDASIGNTQIFTYYLNNENEAMAMIHPQSATGMKERGEAWRSGQGIATGGLRALKIYQANHGVENATTLYQICDFDTQEVLAEKRMTVPGTSADKLAFAVEELKRAPQMIFLRTDSLPSPNGKPLVMREYAGGRFSMNHG
jgi:hypothetical protein